MGVIFDFLNELDIAMEADDITKDAIDDVNAVGASDENNGEIDMNTNDILGTSDNGNGEKGDEISDTPEGDESGDDTPDEGGEDSSGDLDSAEGEENTDSSGDETSDDMGLEDGGDTDDEFTLNRKKKLRDQFIHFFDILDDSIKLITSHVPNVTDTDTIRALNNVTENLTQCKMQVYDILTNNFQKSEYHDLLKKYVALNRIYDLSIKIMERYFEKYRPDNDEKQKSSKKDEDVNEKTSN